jgi:rhomboid protease GluP
MYQQDQYPESNYPPPQSARLELPQSVPYVTYAILGLTVLVYLAQMLSEALLGGDLPAYFGMKINEFIVAGQLWRLFTPALLHGSILHIGFNMYALIIFGTGLERFFGHGRFLLLYLAGAFAGNVFSFLITPNPSLGASTAVFGLIGAQAVFLYRHRELFGDQARSSLQSILFIAGINFVIGLQPGIDNWGHLGGLLGGLIFAWFGGPKLVVEGLYPLLQIKDEHGNIQAATATLIVLFIFGALTIIGMGAFGFIG